MAKIIDARIKLKRSTTTAEVPTVAPSNDHLDGTWDALDIYKGEMFVNTVDTKAWIRTDDGIMQMPFLKDNQNNSYNSATASGTNTYTITLTPTLTAYVFGQTFVVSFTNANTGAATINVDSLGAKAIQKNGTALSSGDLGAGKSYILFYNGTAFQVLGLTSSGGGITNSAANNYVTKSDGTNVVQSQIFDDGSFIGIGATSALGFEVFRLDNNGVGFAHTGHTTAYVSTFLNSAANGGIAANTTDFLLTNDSGVTLTLSTSNVTSNGNIIPTVTNSKSLGSDTYAWQNLYLTSSVIFEGSTADGFETTLTVTDPTADRTITLPNATGTVALTADKLSVFASTTSSELAGVISDETGTGALVFATNPTMVAPILTSTALSSSAGKIEYLTNTAYFTPNTSNTGVLRVKHFIRLTADYTLANSASAQKLFDGGTANGTITLPSNVAVKFKIAFDLTSMSTTTGDFSFGFAGTATVSNIKYMSTAAKRAFTSGTSNGGWAIIKTTAATSLCAATTNANGYAYIEGYLSITTGGTIIPQVTLGIAAAAVVGANSYAEFEIVGADTVQTVGNWS